jgi:hypothetical protein
VLVPGNAAKSRMYRMAAGLDKPAMPLGGKLKAEDLEASRYGGQSGHGVRGSFLLPQLGLPQTNEQDAARRRESDRRICAQRA